MKFKLIFFLSFLSTMSTFGMDQEMVTLQNDTKLLDAMDTFKRLGWDLFVEITPNGGPRICVTKSYNESNFALFFWYYRGDNFWQSFDSKLKEEKKKEADRLKQTLHDSLQGRCIKTLAENYDILNKDEIEYSSIPEDMKFQIKILAEKYE